jgi:hypothetical protein
VRGSVPRPGCLYPRERPGTHCTGCWVGPRAGLDRGKSRPHRYSIPDRPSRSQSLYRLSYRAHSECLMPRFRYVKEQYHTRKENVNSVYKTSVVSLDFTRIRFLIYVGNKSLKFSDFEKRILKYLNNFCQLSSRRPNSVLTL